MTTPGGKGVKGKSEREKRTKDILLPHIWLKGTSQPIEEESLPTSPPHPLKPSLVPVAVKVPP